MAFWQENYQFIKEIYEMRHSKMAEWMENVEKVIFFGDFKLNDIFLGHRSHHG